MAVKERVSRFGFIRISSVHTRPLAVNILQSKCTTPQVTSNTEEENKGEDTVQCIKMGIQIPSGLK